MKKKINYKAAIVLPGWVRYCGGPLLEVRLTYLRKIHIHYQLITLTLGPPPRNSGLQQKLACCERKLLDANLGNRHRTSANTLNIF